jgi:hypothetical protein
MPSRIVAKLVLPTTLAVAAIVIAPSCKSDDNDDNSDGTGDHGDEDYCEDIESSQACDDAAGCGWDGSYCENECHLIDDQAACEDSAFCDWGEGYGDTGTDGEGESCHQPFT